MAMTKTNPLVQLEQYGQSVWLDNFRRGWIVSGELARMIRDDALKGVTVNPTIFEKAVSGSTDYDDAIRKLVDQKLTTEQIYEALMVEDIRLAAELFRPIYDATDGLDGYVSIELPPAIARDTDATIFQAKRYHDLVGRENILIKVPGTVEAIPAIEQLTYEGLNINITLLFSNDRYEQVAHAYVRGLRRRNDAGKLLGRVASVASFFVSRIDTMIDRQLEDMAQGTQDEAMCKEIDFLHGKTAVANAKMAYQQFKKIFATKEFKEIELRGARPQRLLWASTSTKNPRYPDVYYAENLVGPQTVDTMPTQTLFAFKDHGVAFPTLEQNLQQADDVLNRIKAAGIDLDAVTAKLEEDGLKSFQVSVDNLMARLGAKHENIHRLEEGRQTARLGDHQARVDYALEALSEQGFTRRLWEKDPSLWKQGPDGEKEIKDRLGWLGVVENMCERTTDLVHFADEVKLAGFKFAVLLGMGGSSLCPEVTSQTFGVKLGYPKLLVLDSTVPSAAADIEREIDPANTLFIVATKSGGTVETLSAYKHFFELVKKKKGDRANENFVAITDPGSSLEKEAADKKFRRTFLNFPDIGGRYSALSYFGLVPAAIIGVDIDLLLHRAWEMVESNASCISASEAPGVILGTIMGELALEGRNKLTLICSPEISSFGLWVEQLVAESTGKNGQGIVPIDGEPLDAPGFYGDDRLFVYMKLRNSEVDDMEARVLILEQARQPVVRILLDDVYDLGQEYFRWEVATSVACAILGVNAFDQPNVTESKNMTGSFLKEFQDKGKLPEQSLIMEEDGVKLFGDDETKNVLDKIRSAGPYADDSLLSYVAAYLDQFQPGNYFAFMAFVKQTPEVDEIFAGMRSGLMYAYSASTTLGYGPRFLHSTGQLHKGGPNTGLFIQFTADDSEDVSIPGDPYTFSTLKEAQSLGDGSALRAHGRPMIRLHTGPDVVSGLKKILDVFTQATEEQAL